jgi:DNA-binding MarR family transcriptional regulator
MEQLFEFFLKQGLRPMALFDEMLELEQSVNRSELAAVLMLQHHGEMTMTELAAALGAPLSTLTSLAKRLAAKGYIERSQSGQDQRITLIRLAEPGRILGDSSKETMNRVLARVQTVLSDEEQEQFIRLFMKVAKALQQKTDVHKETAKPPLRKIEIE